MKKLLTVFLALAFLVGTIGCPKAEKKTTPAGGGVKPAGATEKPAGETEKPKT
jgi:hypothetical protein